MARATDPIAVPLLLAPSYDAKTWGGRRLESLGKSLPPGKIGESLESGPEAVIDGGPFDGVTLGELSRTHSRALLGRRGVAASGSLNDFPLLAKLIDANDDLSVQVHPDDVSAPAGRRGKTEAWYILDAQPGARIVSGVRGPIQIDRIREQLVETAVQPGEVYFVPAGTVHAIGAGVLLYEIQQASDVTWRLFDWGRQREIHVDAALAAARPQQFATRIIPLRVTDDRDMLVACRHFALERLRVDGSDSLPSFPEAFRVITVLEGDVTVGGVLVRNGATAVLPADLPEQMLEGHGSFLLGYIPDLELDIRRPLLDAGHDPDSIKRIGADL
jgi:mannose-6-phosphate isomerase